MMAPEKLLCPLPTPTAMYPIYTPLAMAFGVSGGGKVGRLPSNRPSLHLLNWVASVFHPEYEFINYPGFVRKEDFGLRSNGLMDGLDGESRTGIQPVPN